MAKAHRNRARGSKDDHSGRDPYETKNRSTIPRSTSRSSGAASTEVCRPRLSCTRGLVSSGIACQARWRSHRWVRASIRATVRQRRQRGDEER